MMFGCQGNTWGVTIQGLRLPHNPRVLLSLTCFI
ncbi:hypothetical protein LINGRAHAP2_LOCUS11693 [Linum grandiflorum]